MADNMNENPSVVTNTEGTAQEVKATSMGMEENIESLLCYLFSWVTGLIFLLAEKNNKTVKFHAIQSLILGIAVVALYIILDNILLVALWSLWSIISLITTLIGIGYLVLSIILMVKAYHNEKMKLPIIGDFAEKKANK